MTASAITVQTRLPLSRAQWDEWIKLGPDTPCQRCGDPRKAHKNFDAHDVGPSGSSSGKAKLSWPIPEAHTACTPKTHFCFCTSFVEPGGCICMTDSHLNPNCLVHASRQADAADSSTPEVAARNNPITPSFFGETA